MSFNKAKRKHLLELYHVEAFLTRTSRMDRELLALLGHSRYGAALALNRNSTEATYKAVMSKLKQTR